MSVGPVAFARTGGPSRVTGVPTRPVITDAPARRVDPDHEAWARARYAALREQRPRFETAQHRVDVYL